MRPNSKWKADNAELRATVSRDEFLSEWLSAANSDRVQFENETANLDNAGRESVALKAGFRTWRNLLDCQRDMHRTLEHYSAHPTFITLWQRLRDCDTEIDWGPMLYGPHNGGVPRALLRSIETWHESPKFTAAELAKHKAKIVKMSGDLIALIAQVSPGNFSDRFAAFCMTANETEKIFAIFKSPKNLKQIRGKALPPFWASELLQRAGVTPVWALQNIMACAQLRGADVLPTKVRAPTAFRTYLIHAVCSSVAQIASHGEPPISDQLVADVVSLLSNKDCTADDVRKAMSARRKRDRASLLEHSTPRS